MTTSAVDDYLAALPEEPRAALNALRSTIRAIVPESTETISYLIPTFSYLGPLVGFAAFKDHCSFFLLGTELMGAFAEDLAGYKTNKGSIRFSPSEPLPVDLVTKLVRARIAENEAKRKG